MAQENQERQVDEHIEQITPVINEKKKLKKPSLKIILISIIAFLVLLLIIGFSIIIFFPKEEAPVEVKEEVTVKEEVVEEKEPEVKFDLSSINSQKLNEQLANLTNKNLQKEPEDIKENEESRRVLEEQKRIEEESLKIEEDLVLKQKESLEEKKAELEIEMQKLEALKQEAIMAREELLKAQNTNIQSQQNEVEKEDNSSKIVKKEEPSKESIEQNSGEFLQLINVAKVKGVLYKKYLDKATSIDSNILLCRDDLNRIELYYGPFTSNELRETLLNRLLKNGFSQAYEVEMTKDEFNKRCNY